MIELTVATLRTVGGCTAFVILATQWLKHYLVDWRWTNLLSLALGLASALVAVWVTEGTPEATSLVNAGLIGLVAASVATFGYEAIANLLGKAGIGERSG